MEFFNFLMEQYAAYKGTAGTPKEEFPRTVPLVSKVCNTQMARLATRLTPFLRSKCPLSSPKSGAGRGLLCPEKLPIQHSGIHFLSE